MDLCNEEQPEISMFPVCQERAVNNSVNLCYFQRIDLNSNGVLSLWFRFSSLNYGEKLPDKKH